MVAPAGDYGIRGDPIPGSRYVRDFCRLCGDPIRVSSVTGITLALCEGCDESMHGRTRRVIQSVTSAPEGVREKRQQIDPDWDPAPEEDVVVRRRPAR